MIDLVVSYLQELGYEAKRGNLGAYLENGHDPVSISLVGGDIIISSFRGYFVVAGLADPNFDLKIFLAERIPLCILYGAAG